jgi:hypothetical protein
MFIARGFSARKQPATQIDSSGAWREDSYCDWKVKDDFQARYAKGFLPINSALRKATCLTPPRNSSHFPQHAPIKASKLGSGFIADPFRFSKLAIVIIGG